MQIEELKNYAVSLFRGRHNATIYFVGNVLPVNADKTITAYYKKQYKGSIESIDPTL
jgi:hypothetical protein